jgi:hypothetical protein
VPSTLTVTNNLDSGRGSLRYEIAHAQNKDTIVFAAALAGQTITLTSGELLIPKSASITINGPGADLLTISAGGQSRIFEVPAKTGLSLSGLTLSNGSAGNGEGGAIYNDSVLTVTDCNLSNNHAYAGGAFYNRGTAKITGGNMSGNYAPGPDYDLGDGGAIDNDYGATMQVTGVALSDNWAGGRGGAMYNAGTMTVSSCTLSGNYDYSGDTIYTLNGTLSVSNSSFSGNKPPYSASPYWYISGMYSDGGGNSFA